MNDSSMQSSIQNESAEHDTHGNESPNNNPSNNNTNNNNVYPLSPVGRDVTSEQQRSGAGGRTVPAGSQRWEQLERSWPSVLPEKGDVILAANGLTTDTNTVFADTIRSVGAGNTSR